MSLAFTKDMRLRTRRDYQRMSYQFKRHVGHLIIIDVKEGNNPATRLGITVSRRYGKAHERNHFKRIVREAYRLCHERLPIGLDLNVRPRTAAQQAGRDEVVQEFLMLVQATVTKGRETKEALEILATN